MALTSKTAPSKRIGGVFLAALCLGVLLSLPAIANPGTDEYKLKAALIYKLAKFVTWPPRDGENNTFGICVLGRDDFGSALDALKERRLGDQSIGIHHFGQSEGIHGECQIVFISASKKAFVTDIANAIGDRPILTVGDSKDFAAQGGMVEFVLDSGRIGFNINRDRVEHAGLKIAAPLLGIANIVHERKGKP